MSSPSSTLATDIQNAITGFIDAVAMVFSGVASALQTYAPTIGVILVSVGLGYLAFKIMSKSSVFKNILNIFTGL